MSDSSDYDDQINYGQDDLDSDDTENEVLASEDDDDDEDEDDYLQDDRFNRFKIEMKKDEMASDLEDDDEDDDERGRDDAGLPSSQAWGKNKKSYYNTDYIDKDYRGQKQRDEDLAQYEEEEARQIQKRLLSAITEQDLGIDLLIDPSKQIQSTKEKKQSEKLGTTLPDISILSHSQKIALVKQESPELELLKSDFEKYSKEIQNELEPLISKLIKQKAKPSSGLKFLKQRLLILTNYCTNIACYFSMKCSQDRQIVKDHPIIKRLFIFKKMITELDSVLERNPAFLDELKFVQNKKKLKFLDATTSIVDYDDDNDQTIEEAVDDDDDIAGGNEDETMIDDDEKRAITYEMQKNKGLTPKRKREQRNPRVKYRKKFEKAVVRRKGQVREPRKELKKYGGELTGINVRAIKSVKFK